ncbi:protein of unknown function [Cyanobium sp. NIES-981]|nr:protein of unknown function [Cyanobium sp. NIES-981]
MKRWIGGADEESARAEILSSGHFYSEAVR